MMRARSKLVWLVAACALALFAAALIPSARDVSSARSSFEPSLQEAGLQEADEAPPEAPAVRTAAPPGTLASTAAPDRHPHPITAEHRRLYREADLLDGAVGLLRKSSVAQARSLLAQHRAEYAPRQGSDNEGLGLLADCIERRDTASVENARAFYARYTHSMVRRQIRKQCLE